MLEKLEKLIIEIIEEENLQDKWKVRERLVEMIDTIIFPKK